VPAVFYLPVIFYVAEITNRSAFSLFVLANFLSILCSTAVGLFIASSSKDMFVRNLWLFGLTTFFATFGGIHTAANSRLPWILRWIQYLSPTYYLFLITIRLEFSDSEIANVLSIGKFILDTGEAFGALAVLTVAYLFCAFFAAYLSTMPRRLLF
jgi:ABC-type multidrug transport system permease subunit